MKIQRELKHVFQFTLENFNDFWKIRIVLYDFVLF